MLIVPNVGQQFAGPLLLFHFLRRREDLQSASTAGRQPWLTIWANMQFAINAESLNESPLGRIAVSERM